MPKTTMLSHLLPVIAILLFLLVLPSCTDGDNEPEEGASEQMAKGVSCELKYDADNQWFLAKVSNNTNDAIALTRYGFNFNSSDKKGWSICGFSRDIGGEVSPALYIFGEPVNDLIGSVKLPSKAINTPKWS
jgi:hypothetical protein